MIYLCFIGLPFSFFYAQSIQDEEEEQDINNGMLGGGNCGMIKGMDSPESSDEDLNKGKLPDLED